MEDSTRAICPSSSRVLLILECFVLNLKQSLYAYLYIDFVLNLNKERGVRIRTLLVTTMTETQMNILLTAQETKLEIYEAKIERLEAKIDELIDELNDSDRKFIELRKAYKALKKSKSLMAKRIYERLKRGLA